MPHEENRKIIRAGNTSYAVILPKAWLRYYGLKKGDRVKIVSNGIVTVEPLKHD
jgi:bifunctional DNA-binding transcriptional regulator/antitoxin component of YhaV-PrlF toxin-antitoxin module